jgi:hypothetical protein
LQTAHLFGDPEKITGIGMLEPPKFVILQQNPIPDLGPGNIAKLFQEYSAFGIGGQGIGKIIIVMVRVGSQRFLLSTFDQAVIPGIIVSLGKALMIA